MQYINGALLLFALTAVDAFTSPSTLASSSQFCGKRIILTPKVSPARSSTSLQMFLGNDGGFLGVGAPEVVRNVKRLQQEYFVCFELSNVLLYYARPQSFLSAILYSDQAICIR